MGHYGQKLICPSNLFVKLCHWSTKVRGNTIRKQKIVRIKWKVKEQNIPNNIYLISGKTFIAFICNDCSYKLF